MSSLKVGHFTLDNAANNGTMMKSLKRMLKEHDVAFDATDRKIMCFAHIINLCSGQVTRKAENRDDDDDDSDSSQSDDETVASSPIARARNVVRIIRASGMVEMISWQSLIPAIVKACSGKRGLVSQSHQRSSCEMCAHDGIQSTSCYVDSMK